MRFWENWKNPKGGHLDISKDEQFWAMPLVERRSILTLIVNAKLQ